MVYIWLGTVAHACNLALWEAEVGGSQTRSGVRDQHGQYGEPISTKNTKISQAWWCTPIVPATWEAETQELLELRRWKLL